jgi:hypothetical protein
MNGIWCARCWVRYPVSFCWRHAAPLGFVGGILLALALSLLFKPFLWLLLLGLAFYAVVSLVAGIQVASRHGWRYLPVVPLLMLTYHLVYGASTIAGLLQQPWRSANTAGSLAHRNDFGSP